MTRLLGIQLLNPSNLIAKCPALLEQFQEEPLLSIPLIFIWTQTSGFAFIHPMLGCSSVMVCANCTVCGPWFKFLAWYFTSSFGPYLIVIFSSSQSLLHGPLLSLLV